MIERVPAPVIRRAASSVGWVKRKRRPNTVPALSRVGSIADARPNLHQRLGAGTAAPAAMRSVGRSSISICAKPAISPTITPNCSARS